MHLIKKNLAFLLIFLAFHSTHVLAGAPCSGCVPCSSPCSGSTGTQCVLKSTETRDTGEITELPFIVPLEVIDKGCFGEVNYQVNLTEIPNDVTVLDNTENVSEIPYSSITGSTEVGECVSCGGCSCPD